MGRRFPCWVGRRLGLLKNVAEAAEEEVDQAQACHHGSGIRTIFLFRDPRESVASAVSSLSMQRHCARPGCAVSASSTLTYEYGARTVWIDPLSDEAHPMTHDLCTRHANALSVPNGWLLQDRRVDAAQLFVSSPSMAS